MKTTTTFAVLFLLLAGHRTADAQTVTVALSGDTAPGTSAPFSSVGGPVLNDAGQTAFIGLITSATANRGIWSEGGGSGLALVARSGNVAPSTSNTFASFNVPVLNNAGQTAFRGGLNSSGAANRGIWSEGGGSGLALIAREGNVAPGTSDTFFLFNDPVLNDAGQTAFRGRLRRLNSSAVTSGIWSEGGGSGLALVAHQGSTAPGTGGIFAGLDASPVLNNAGQTAFLGGYISSSGGPFISGIWSEGGGSGLALVTHQGNTAPGTSNDFSGFFPPVLNDAGQTAFLGRLNSSNATNGGIWSEGGGSGLALVAREGNVAPGTSDTFFFFVPPVLNNAGQTAFLGGLNSSSTTSRGIWAEGGGGSGLALVAREGNMAPGTSDTFADFERLVFNDAGQTAFLGDLNSSSQTNRGIWAEDQAGVLTLIAREGDLFDVDDGLDTDFRTISSLGFLGNTGNGDGRRSSFNNLGQLAFQAAFTDGSRGIFVSNLVAVVPEPTSFMLSTLGLFGLGATHRRRRRKC